MLNTATPYQSQYLAWLLSRRMGMDSADLLASTLVDAKIDLNPHQVEAALFAFHSPLWKLLASSSYAIGGALGTMAQRLQDKLGTQVADKADEQLNAELDKDYESLDETEEEWAEQDGEPAAVPLVSVAEEIAELREFQRMATTIRDNAKGQALLIALGKAFAALERLDAHRKALICVYELLAQKFQLFEGVFGASDEVLGTVAATLEEKLHWQKRQRELEDKRSQLRRRIFDRQDEIDGRRSQLIDDLEGRLSSKAQMKRVFTMQWCLD